MHVIADQFSYGLYVLIFKVEIPQSFKSKFGVQITKYVQIYMIQWLDLLNDNFIPLLPCYPLHFHDGFATDSSPVVEVFLHIVVNIFGAKFEMQWSES